MTYWLSILAVTAAVLGVIKLFTSELNWREFWILFIAVAFISGLLIGTGTWRNSSDVQVLNGQVVSKKMERVHCRHSYSCHCYTTCSGYGKHRHCSQHCQTCYDHKFDQDWDIITTLGNYEVDKIDRQGLREPARWTIVEPGEPVHRAVSYTNYIKASPESLFHKVLKHKYVVPKYPSKVFDYYRIDRVVQTNTSLPFAKQLNAKLNDILKTIGPIKQVNIVPVFTTYDQNFGEVLQQEWLGGKKNDVVVVVGFDKNFSDIKWVKVFSWSKSALVNYEIQDHLMSLGKFDVDSYVQIVSQDIAKSYIRRPMSDFKYLDDAIEPPDWAIFVSIIMGFLIVGFGGFYMTRRGVDF